jgi:hypothetical protein
MPITIPPSMPVTNSTALAHIINDPIIAFLLVLLGEMQVAREPQGAVGNVT